MASKRSLFWLMTLACLVHTMKAAPTDRKLQENIPLDSAIPMEQFDITDSVDLFEGDIAGIDLEKAKSSGSFRAALKSQAKNALLESFYHWPSGQVPYVISQKFNATEAAQITTALEEINTVTQGIVLIPRTDQYNYVFIARGGPRSGCWSYVGVIGAGEQVLNLEVAVNRGDPHCMHHGIIQHEMLHAIGLYHEQSRTDRNDFVDINWDNIPENQQHNFEYYNDQYVTPFGQPYDFGSLMHYGEFDFAINRTIWTIRPKYPYQELEIGQRRGLSAVDIAKLDVMYPPNNQTV